jgi:hypothetical protein
VPACALVNGQGTKIEDAIMLASPADSAAVPDQRVNADLLPGVHGNEFGDRQKLHERILELKAEHPEIGYGEALEKITGGAYGMAGQPSRPR